MGTSFVLYIAGIATAVKAALPRDPLKGSLIFCFALASPLFLYFNLTVGQLATVAVFSAGFAIYLEKRSMLFFSGMALSILTYKPTLLLLIVPMLLLTRRFRTFFGFAVGTICAIPGIDGICGFADLAELCAFSYFLCWHRGYSRRIQRETVGIRRLQLFFIRRCGWTIATRAHDSRLCIARTRNLACETFA